METTKKILLCEARGPIMDLIDKLSGENGNEWLTRLKKCLRQDGNYPIWGKLKTIIYSDDTILLNKLDGVGRIINKQIYDTRELIKRVCSESKVAATYNLVEIVPADLGFTNLRPTLEEFYTKALNEGLELCPAIVGPELSFEYDKLCENNSFYIAMDPLITKNEQRVIFQIYYMREKSSHAICVMPYDLESKIDDLNYHKWLFVAKK